MKLPSFINTILNKKNNKIALEKENIRSDIRFFKKSLDQKDKTVFEESVFCQVEKLDVFKNAQVILMYWAIKDELPTQNTLKKWSEFKTILLPCIEGEKLLLKKYNTDGKLVQKSLGIFEPELPDFYKGIVDLVIVPGIAFDKEKNRLGRGKGYYDRFFKQQKPVKIGVGFDFQLLDSVPVQKHDIKMDYIVTPSSLLR